jgi:membrane-bound lytic murein transglycosylase F
LIAINNGEIDIDVVTYDDIPTEQLIEWVAEEEIDITVADSNIARLNQRYFPDIKIGIPISESQSLAWAVKKNTGTLLAAVNEFFRITKTNGTFDSIYKAYYGNEEVFDRYDVKKFHQRIQSRLPSYEKIIKAAVADYGFDWRLIAATIYQESHFNPRARSHRGVRGLMQLTLVTAKEMGVTNRLDPEQSIRGGVKYLHSLHDRFSEAEGLDRILFALASYNVGSRHVRNAQQIARKQGLDPHKWTSLEKTLPLLCQEEFVRSTPYGYCRGTEPVRFVNRILLYYDILKKQERAL